MSGHISLLPNRISLLSDYISLLPNRNSLMYNYISLSLKRIALMSFDYAQLSHDNSLFSNSIECVSIRISLPLILLPPFHNQVVSLPNSLLLKQNFIIILKNRIVKNIKCRAWLIALFALYNTLFHTDADIINLLLKSV